ncbi:MAG TPA: hypothetical protein VHK90_01430 [Thermoanaerobaculia bacterium]|nr:hypothetical protein [Thermoanaerobaculia bacterium]
MKSFVPALAFLIGTFASAQQVQIPTLQVCNIGKVSGSANVYLSKRDDALSAGTIDITAADVGCDPINGDGVPTGSITMRFSLSDSSISDMQVTHIEQISTIGKHTTTTYLNGRCTANGGTIPCHFWLTLADNRTPSVPGTPDVVGVLVLDKKGTMLTYGTGPVKSGDISVTQY